MNTNSLVSVQIADNTGFTITVTSAQQKERKATTVES